MELTKEEMAELPVEKGFELVRVHVTTANEIEAFLNPNVKYDNSKEHRKRVVEEISRVMRQLELEGNTLR